MDGGEESFGSGSGSFNFRSSYGVYSDDDDPDTYFELELCPGSYYNNNDNNNDDQEFEFRVSFSAVVPFPGFTTAAFASPKCEDTDADTVVAFEPPSQHPQPPPPAEINSWGLVQNRKVWTKIMNKSSMMKFVVKLRSIMCVRGWVGGMERWFGSVRKEERQIMVRRRFFGNPFKIGKSFPTTSCIKSSPLHQLPAAAAGGGGVGEYSSSVHSAIAHCKKSLIPLNQDHFSF